MLPRASPDDPVVGNRSNPSLLSSWGWRNVPFPSSSLYQGCSPPSETLAIPPGKRTSAFWMRASTTPTTWMEETEAKSSCMGSLRDRDGLRHQKRGFGALTLLVFIPEGAEPEGETAQPRRGWWGRRWALFPVLENPGLVLEANDIGGHSCHKCSRSQLLCRVAKRTRAWRGDVPLRDYGDKGQDLKMEVL